MQLALRPVQPQLHLPHPPPALRRAGLPEPDHRPRRPRGRARRSWRSSEPADVEALLALSGGARPGARPGRAPVAAAAGTGAVRRRARPAPVRPVRAGEPAGRAGAGDALERAAARAGRAGGRSTGGSRTRGLSPLTDGGEGPAPGAGRGRARALAGRRDDGRGPQTARPLPGARGRADPRRRPPRGPGGVTTLRIGWKSGAWTELRVRRPSTADHARTPPRRARAHPRQRGAGCPTSGSPRSSMPRADDPAGLALDGGARRADSALPPDPHRVPGDADACCPRRAAAGRWARVRGRGRGAPGGRPERARPLAQVGLPARRAARPRRPAVGPAHARGPRPARRDAGGPGPRPLAAPRGPPRVGGHPGATLGATPGGARSSPTAPASPTTGSGASARLPPTPPRPPATGPFLCKDSGRSRRAPATRSSPPPAPPRWGRPAARPA